MSSLLGLMTELRRARVRIWVEGEQLRYQAPKGALTPLLRAVLRPRKADILEFVGRAQAGTEAFPLGPVPRDGDQQISLAQYPLWVLDQMHGPTPTYNISLALRLTGILDVSALRQGFEAILQRHESLRTAFHAEGDTVRPMFSAACRLPWRTVDLQQVPADRQSAEVRGQAHDEALRPFDLSCAPLIRCVLWTLSGRDHVLMMTVHHIVADGRSIEIISAELSALYEGYRCGKDVALPELRVQYADFAWHQRKWLTDALLQGQLDYWRKQLAGMPVLELPTDRLRAAVVSSAGASVSCRLTTALVDRLRDLGRRSGTTLYMSLLAGAAALLARYTGRDDIPIVCPATHRDRQDLDALIGFFVNPLVLRFDLSSNPSFREVLGRVRGVVTDAFANQSVPFDKVVESSRSKRNPGSSPLAQFSMVMLSAEKTRLRLNDLETEPFDFGNPITRSDLALEIYEADGAVEIFWVYKAGLFDTDTVSRMAQHLRNILEAAVAAPEQALADLPLFDQSELREFIRSWNDPKVDPSQHAFLHRVLETQARIAPDAVALTQDGRRLTYGDLMGLRRRFWHGSSSEALPVLNLPTDDPRPAVQRYRGREQSFVLAPARLEALQAFARQRNATLFMALHAILKALLFAYTGQDDIVVGCVIAGREHPDLADQVGLYLNTLAMRSRIRGEMAFEAFFGEVAQATKDAFDHQTYQFDQLVGELNVPRDLSRFPLFDVMLIEQNQDEPALDLDGLRARPAFEHTGTSKFDLTF